MKLQGAHWVAFQCTFLLVMVLPTLLSGCATSPASDGSNAEQQAQAKSTLDKALEALGFKQPDMPAAPDKPDIPLPDRRIRLRLAASESLNLNAHGQSVALLTRIYKMKNADAFLKAPYEAFGDSAKEKDLLGSDLIESRDLQLIPGQHHDATDKVSRDVSFIGIVALYRAPAANHWRFVFNANKAEWTGLSIGLHACAMSVHIGEALGESARTYQSAALPCPVSTASASPQDPENKP